DFVDGDKTDIVPVRGVLGTGIAEPYDQVHRCSPGDRKKRTGRHRPARTDYSASPPSSAPSSSASPSDERRADGAAMVAMVKSRSVMVGTTFSGRVTLEICMVPPTSTPSRSTTRFSGIESA